MKRFARSLALALALSLGSAHAQEDERDRLRAALEGASSKEEALAILEEMRRQGLETGSSKEPSRSADGGKTPAPDFERAEEIRENESRAARRIDEALGLTAGTFKTLSAEARLDLVGLDPEDEDLADLAESMADLEMILEDLDPHAAPALRRETLEEILAAEGFPEELAGTLTRSDLGEDLHSLRTPPLVSPSGRVYTAEDQAWFARFLRQNYGYDGRTPLTAHLLDLAETRIGIAASQRADENHRAYLAFTIAVQNVRPIHDGSRWSIGLPSERESSDLLQEMVGGALDSLAMEVVGLPFPSWIMVAFDVVRTLADFQEQNQLQRWAEGDRAMGQIWRRRFSRELFGRLPPRQQRAVQFGEIRENRDRPLIQELDAAIRDELGTPPTLRNQPTLSADD